MQYNQADYSAERKYMIINIRGFRLNVEVERDDCGLIESVDIIEAWKELDTDPLNHDTKLLSEIAQELDALDRDEVAWIAESHDDERRADNA